MDGSIVPGSLRPLPPLHAPRRILKPLEHVHISAVRGVRIEPAHSDESRNAFVTDEGTVLR